MRPAPEEPPEASVPQATPAFSEEQIGRVMAGLVLAIFVAAVDGTLISVALLPIGQDLGQVEQLPWVMSGYLAASAVATPIYGKLSDLYGRKPLMLGSLLGFALTSLGSALAPDMQVLIGMRILQGLTGGAVIAMAQAIIADVVPVRERGRYQGWLAATFASAALAGPVIGGLVTGALGWRAVFALLVPLTLLATWRVSAVLSLIPTHRQRRPIDWPGALWLAIALSSLMSLLTLLGQGKPPDNPAVLMLACACLIATVLGVVQERRAPEPILPPEVLALRGVWVPCVNVVCIFFTIIGLSTMLPIALQTAAGLGVDQAALRMLPLTLGIPCGAFIAGRWTYRTGASRRIIFIGLLLVLLALTGMASLPVTVLWSLALAMGLLGVGSGMVMVTSLVVAQSSVPGRHMGVTTAVVACARTVGSAVGVSILAAVLFVTLRELAPQEPDLRRLLEVVPPSAAGEAFRVVIGVAWGVSLLGLLTMLAAGRGIGAGLR